MEQENLTPFSNYGLWLNPNELRKCSHITIWGQALDDNGFGPWFRVLQIPIDMERIKKKTALIGTYISCEV